MIILDDVEKCYGKRCVLQGVDLTVDKGDFIAIMGRSGSGKSTLLNLVGGMDIPDRGTVTVDGEDISSLPDKLLTLYRRKKIGFIFQFFNLLPTITVYENIEIPLLLNGMDQYRDKIISYLELVGLKGREGDLPHQLSGGEQQRVAIARAIVHDPAILLADEPTGNLDSKTGKAIMEIIRDISKVAGKTVLLVTHDDSIASYADRIIKIRDGLLFQ